MNRNNESDAAMALAAQRAFQYDQNNLSADKTKTLKRKTRVRKKKVPCVWTLDTTCVGIG